MNNPNNEPAFPYAFEHENDGGFSPGMSLRDYFAAKSISCFYVDENEFNQLLSGAKPRYDIVAKFCYDLADAMLEARKQ